MGDRQHTPKRGAQKLNNSISNTTSKPVRAKISKLNHSKEMLEEDKTMETSSVTSMFDMIMTKLGKLDIIDNRMKSVEQELKEISIHLSLFTPKLKTSRMKTKSVRRAMVRPSKDWKSYSKLTLI